MVRRGATVANPLVQAQVQAARVDPGDPAGAALQVPQLQRVLQVPQGLHRSPQLPPFRQRERRESRRAYEQEVPQDLRCEYGRRKVYWRQMCYA